MTKFVSAQLICFCVRAARICVGAALLVAAFVAFAATTPVSAAEEVPTPLDGITRLEVGYGASCAFAGDNNPICWGWSFSPMASSGLEGYSKVLDVAIGGNHRCILIGGGAVLCRGYNADGQLGIGNTNDMPDNVWYYPNGLTSGVTALSVGFGHTCALMENTTVRCWGLNVYGQTGMGMATEEVTVPTEVPNLSTVVAIEAGSSHTCALSGLGTIACWGRGDSGQLGDGTQNNRPFPVGVKQMTNAVSIAAGGQFTCAVRKTGAVACWGNNAAGQLGDSTQDIRKLPTQVLGLGSGFVSVGAGDHNACALASNGAVFCWGINSFGQLGNGTSGIGMKSLVPVGVLGLTAPATQLGVGHAHACALLSTGQVQCWGNNSSHETGDGTDADVRSTATTVLTTITCYALTLGHQGMGNDPAVVPAMSAGCPAGHYVQGEPLTVTPQPAPGWTSVGYTVNGNAGVIWVGPFTMPAADMSIAGNYAQCHALTLTHTGEGANPVATPANAYGCAAGSYLSGWVVTLTAAPAAGHVVAGWTGTGYDGSTALDNFVKLPNGPATASVTYAPSPQAPGDPNNPGNPGGGNSGVTSFAAYLPLAARP